MKKNNVKVDILPNYFLKKDGTFDKEKALRFSGKIAGVCYDKEGFAHIDKEDEQKTMRRVDRTLNSGHHSVYDHVTISFNIQNIPKILAMVLNNEHQYATSEKSARYTPVIREEDSFITEDEEILYNKWLDIFKKKIKSKYGYHYNDNQIQKLAQENARYLVSVFMPTQMIYSTSFRQINYLVAWMKDYIKNVNKDIDFEKKLKTSMEYLILGLKEANVLEEGLMQNEKKQKLSLFCKDIDKKQEHFSEIYLTTYKGSYAQYAQAHRHRTLSYQLEILNKKEYYVPPIILDEPYLVKEWLKDMETLKKVTPQGELVNIVESGTYNNFILKCKERLCTAAQLEIACQTKTTLEKYKLALEKANHYLASDIKEYSKGARCTFKDFTCHQDCGFKEGKTLERKI